MTMKRCNFYLADIQIRRLKAINDKTGLPLSDILRRAIDEYWEKFERKGRGKACNGLYRVGFVGYCDVKRVYLFSSIEFC